MNLNAISLLAVTAFSIFHNPLETQRHCSFKKKEFLSCDFVKSVFDPIGRGIMLRHVTSSSMNLDRCHLSHKCSVALNVDDAINWDTERGPHANGALCDVCNNTQDLKRFPVGYLNWRVIDKAILGYVSYDFPWLLE